MDTEALTRAQTLEEIANILSLQEIAYYAGGCAMEDGSVCYQDPRADLDIVRIRLEKVQVRGKKAAEHLRDIGIFDPYHLPRITHI